MRSSNLRITDDRDESSPRAEHRSTDERLHRLGLWCKAALFGDADARERCRVEKIGLTRAQGEGTNEAGGYLVPDELEALILEHRDLSGTYRSAARVVQMARDIMKVPKRGSGVSIFFSAEAQQLIESNVVFEGVTLSAKKITGLLTASTELLDDTPTNVGEFLAEEFGSAIAALQDTVGWTGNSTSAHGGMTGIAPKIIDGTHAASTINAAAGHNLATSIDAADLGKLVGALPERFLSTAGFYASSFFIGNCFARLGATSAGVVRTAAGPRPLLHFGGIPILPVSQLPGSGTYIGAAMILLGDMRFAATLGERRGLRLARADQRFIDREQIVFRAVSRFDAVAHTLGDNSVAGPVCALVGAA